MSFGRHDWAKKDQHHAKQKHTPSHIHCSSAQLASSPSSSPRMSWTGEYFRMRALVQFKQTYSVLLPSSSLHCAKLERFTIKSYLPQCIKGWMQRSAFFSLNLFRRENFRSKLFSRNSERRRRWGGGCQGRWYREQFCPRDICRSGNTDPVCPLCWGILTQSKTF